MERSVFSNVACLKAIITRVLSYCVVVFAGIIKIPQILAIVYVKSAFGISLTSLMVETFGYVYNLAYHYRERYPFSSYGDFILLAVQNLLILLLSYRYRKQTGLGIGIVSVFGVIAFVMTTHWTPLYLLRLFVTCNLLVALAARIPQVYSNWARQSTGTLNLITCLGIFGGACTRIWTTLQDVKDNLVLVGYIMSTVLNGVLCVQIIYYRYFFQPKVKKSKKME
eukprot:jgi/Galph1/3047/GphlegSOOS_G1747.1